VKRLACALALLASSGCETVPPEPLFPQQTEFGPEQTFTGTLVMSFERQSFDGCWLDFRENSLSELSALAPSPALADQQAYYSAQVTLIGRKRGMINVTEDGNFGQGYGHLGMYQCLIEARRITAARLGSQ
jgi:hypothetical protein